MLKHTIFSLLACGLVMATESFDNLPGGNITTGETMYGALKAEAGHAEITRGKGRSGAAALRVLGGEGKSAHITFSEPTAAEAWAVPEEGELLEASGSSLVTSEGVLARMTYTITYQNGPSKVTLTVESKPLEGPKTVTAPANPDTYEKLTGSI